MYTILLSLALCLPYWPQDAGAATPQEALSPQQVPQDVPQQAPQEVPQSGGAPQGTRAPTLLLRGALLHSMRRGEEPRVADVLLVGGRIRAIGPEAASESDPGRPAARVLELEGKHLFPGLIDAHVNFDSAHDALYLSAGITLVRDLGGDHSMLNFERAPARRDAVPGPTLLTAGAALDGDPPASATAVVLRNPDAAESYLPILFEENVDFVSVLPGLPEQVWRKVLALSHERGRLVFGPRPRQLTLGAAIEAGQDGFHALDSLLPPGVFWDAVDPQSMKESIAALAASGRPLVPLLHAGAARLEDQSEDPGRYQLFGLLAPSYEAWWRTELEGRRPFLEPERRALGELAQAKQARVLLALHEAGARLLPGSGAPQPWLMPGAALHEELAAWVRAGVPARDVLALVTRDAADALGQAGERGTIEVGAWADVLVLSGDPREDLATLFQPEHVIVRGIALSSAELEQRLVALGERQAAVREEQSRPVEVAAPPQGEEGVVVLEGMLQSEAFGARVTSERYRIVRLDGGATLYTGRVLYAPTAESSGRELTIEQFVRDGRLVQVHVSLKAGDSLLEHDGLWTASSWRMQTRMDGQVINTQAPLREQPVCVDVGSLTALLILGQTPPGERIPVVKLHSAFDAEAVYWSQQFDDKGVFRVRTPVGQRWFRLDEEGGIVGAVNKVGVGWIETRGLSATAFGGAGLPVPEATLAAAVPTAGPGNEPEAEREDQPEGEPQQPDEPLEATEPEPDSPSEGPGG